MPQEELILDEVNRKKLDSIVQQMANNKESDADIQFVVNDFKSKYGLKKKEPSPSGSESSPSPSPYSGVLDLLNKDFERPQDRYEQPVETPPPAPPKSLKPLPKAKIPTFREALELAANEQEKEQALPDVTVNKNVELPADIQAQQPQIPSLPKAEEKFAGTGEIAQPINAFANSLAGMLADASKGLAGAARKLNIAGEYDGKATSDLTLYKFGEWIQKSADEYFPIDKPTQEQFIGKLASGAGSMAGFFLGGALGKAAKLGSTTLPALLGGFSGFGSEYDNAIAAGADEQTALNAGLMGGLINTTEFLPVIAWTKRLDKTTGGAASTLISRKMASLPKGATSSAVMGALEQGGQEAVTQFLTNLSAREIYDASRDIWDGVGESAMLGGILGGTLNGITVAIQQKLEDPNLSVADKAILEQTQEFVDEKANEIKDVAPTDIIRVDSESDAVQALMKQKADLEKDIVEGRVPAEMQEQVTQKIQEIDGDIASVKQLERQSESEIVTNRAEIAQLESDIASLEESKTGATPATQDIIQGNIDEMVASLEQLKEQTPVNLKTNDSKDQTGVPSEIGIRQESVQTEPVETGSNQEVERNRVFQESEQVINEPSTQPIKITQGDNIQGVQPSGQTPARKVSRKGKTPRDQRKIKGDNLKASQLPTNNPTQRAMQYFVSGGKTTYEAIKGLLNNSESEALRKINLRSKTGKSIDAIAHEIWENNINDERFTVQDYKDAVEDVLRSYDHFSPMSKKMLEDASMEINPEQEAEYQYEQELINSHNDTNLTPEIHESVMNTLESMSDEDIQSFVDNYESVQGEFARAASEDFLAGIDEDIEGPTPWDAPSKKDIIQKTTDLFYQIKNADGAAKKRALTQQRKKLLEENPSIKRIDDNIKSIFEQLEQKGKITRKGDCP